MAAAWIASVLGQDIPSEDDEQFRGSLANGVTLCRLLNALSPGTIETIADVNRNDSSTPVHEWRGSLENLSLFLKAAQGFTTETFSAADMEGPGERPQVVECILSLRDWHACATALRRNDEETVALATPAASGSRGDAAEEAPGNDRLGSVSAFFQASPLATFTPEACHIVEKYNGATDGLTYLMQSCTNMLKARMGVAASPAPDVLQMTMHPDVALDAVGPVLETVLGNLTSEYEKRLFAKDNEYKLVVDANEGLRNHVAALRTELEHWRSEAERKEFEASERAFSENEAERALERAEYERLKSRETALLSELAAKDEELASLQREASHQATEQSDEIHRLREELNHLRPLELKFQAVSEENRALYNLVQDLRGNIRVFCRIRPAGATGDASKRVIEPGEENSLAIYSEKHSKWHEYAFDRVFDESSSQEDVYFETKPLVRSVLDGYNVCVFAYGQTGSGKTFTMSGKLSNPGIYTRALNDLFAQRDERSDEADVTIKIQLLEVYNETVRDLLVSETEARRGSCLSIIATRGSGSNVPNAIQEEVRSPEDVFEALARGARNRAVAETKLNERSSRSHQILTVMVSCQQRQNSSRTYGCLHLIDLAGSERIARSGAQGQQLIEAQHINRSLSALGNVMQALAQKRDHVPYRDSKLTQLLQDSLSGSSKTMMFVHVAPEANSAGETMSTLNFGKAVTEITLGEAKRNVDSGASWEMKERLNAAREEVSLALSDVATERERRKALEEECNELKSQLAMLNDSKRSNRRQLAELESSELVGGCEASHGMFDYSEGSLKSTDAIRAVHAMRRRVSGSSDIDGIEDANSLRSSGANRPPQVSRLNLKKIDRYESQNTSQSGTPSSARATRPSEKPSRIPTPLSRSGSLTARTSTETSLSSSPMYRTGSLTCRESSIMRSNSSKESNQHGRATFGVTYGHLGQSQSNIERGGSEMRTSSSSRTVQGMQRRWM